MPCYKVLTNTFPWLEEMYLSIPCYKVLTNTFPQAKVLFCQFHVIKCFNKMVSECEVTKSNREELRKKLKDLVYAANESDYSQLKTKAFKSFSL